MRTEPVSKSAMVADATPADFARRQARTAQPPLPAASSLSLELAAATTGAALTMGTVSHLPAFAVPVAALLVLLAGLSLVTARRGWSGTLARTGRLGLHSAAASESDEAFRMANRVAAPVVGGAGVVGIVLAVLVVILPVPTVATIVLGVLAIAAVLVLLVVGGALGEQAARTVPVPARRPQPTAACSGCVCGGGGCAGLTRSAAVGSAEQPAVPAQGTPTA